MGERNNPENLFASAIPAPVFDHQNISNYLAAIIDTSNCDRIETVRVQEVQFEDEAWGETTVNAEQISLSPLSEIVQTHPTQPVFDAIAGNVYEYSHPTISSPPEGLASENQPSSSPLVCESSASPDSPSSTFHTLIKTSRTRADSEESFFGASPQSDYQTLSFSDFEDSFDKNVLKQFSSSSPRSSVYICMPSARSLTESPPSTPSTIDISMDSKIEQPTIPVADPASPTKPMIRSSTSTPQLCPKISKDNGDATKAKLEKKALKREKEEAKARKKQEKALKKLRKESAVDYLEEKTSPQKLTLLDSGSDSKPDIVTQRATFSHSTDSIPIKVETPPSSWKAVRPRDSMRMSSSAGSLPERQANWISPSPPSASKSPTARTYSSTFLNQDYLSTSSHSEKD